MEEGVVGDTSGYRKQSKDKVDYLMNMKHTPLQKLYED